MLLMQVCIETLYFPEEFIAIRLSAFKGDAHASLMAEAIHMARETVLVVR